MIFITGEHGSGKTHFARLYQARFGYDFIDLGPTLRNIWSAGSPEMSFGDFISEGENRLGKRFADNLLVQEIERRLLDNHDSEIKRDLLLIGSRSIDGINYLRENITVDNGRPKRIVYIEASERILYERYKKREGFDISLQDFKNILDKDRKMGVLSIRPYADWVIRNEGRIDDFESKCVDIQTSLESDSSSKEGQRSRGKERS